MKEFLFEVGRVVRSKQGRDKNRIFVIAEVISEDYVKIVDGDLRKLSNLKLKKVKHLHSTPHMLDIFSIEKLSDSDVRKALIKYQPKCEKE